MVADVPLEGKPYRVALATDEHVMVSVRGAYERSSGQLHVRAESSIAVLRREGATMALAHSIPCPRPRGMAVSPNHGLLLVAKDQGAVSVLDLQRVLAGDAEPELGLIPTVENGSTGIVTLSADGGLAITSEEKMAAISVIDMERVHAGSYSDATIARLATDQAPISVVESPDRTIWYVTCQSTGRDTDTRKPLPGSILAFDAQRLVSDPARALINRFIIGNPVRLALTSDGTRAWVTSRSENRVYCLDVKLLQEGASNPVLTKVVVGQAPVGVALAADDRLVMVANSNRFDAPDEPGQTISVIDAQAAVDGGPAVIAEVEVGAFPRELLADNSGRYVFVTNHNSQSVAMLNGAAFIERLTHE